MTFLKYGLLALVLIMTYLVWRRPHLISMLAMMAYDNASDRPLHIWTRYAILSVPGFFLWTLTSLLIGLGTNFHMCTEHDWWTWLLRYNLMLLRLCFRDNPDGADTYYRIVAIMPNSWDFHMSHDKGRVNLDTLLPWAHSAWFRWGRKTSPHPDILRLFERPVKVDVDDTDSADQSGSPW